MSVFDPANDGTFEYLDLRNHTARRRYVKRVPKEDLEEIVLAVWRGRDAARAENGIRRTSGLNTPRKHTDGDF
jgi:hypothetical protein